MKNKNYKHIFSIIFGISLSLLSVNCVDLEEVSDNSATTTTSAFAGAFEVDEYDLLVQVLYAQLRTATQLNDLVAPAWGGDDITSVRTKAEFVEFDTRSVSASNGRLKAAWNKLSPILVSIVDNIELADGFVKNIDSESPEDAEKVLNLLGELHFLRAHVLHYFLRVHGKAPITLDSSVRITTLSSTLDTYKQIEEDLLYAEENLLDIHPEERDPGAARPNKGSARALLARVYMDWAGWPLKDESKYALAAESARKVISNKVNHGFELLDDFEDLWLEDNQRNSEIVWMLTFNKEFGNRQDNRKYGQVGYPGGAPFNGWDETFAEIKFWEDFPEGPRKDGTFRRDLDDIWPDRVQLSNPIYTKIAGPKDDLDLGKFETSRSDYFIRYADVLLMYAEASARAGQITDQSWAALNEVRTRAGLPEINTGDLAELAYTERKWEFAGEFLRWYDLVRMDRVQEALSDRAPRTTRNSAGELLTVENEITGSLSSSNYYAPIPADVIAENPGFAE